MLNEQHIKSLELLGKFIAETPKEQLDTFIKKYEGMKIEGPTYAEYLDELDKSFCANNLIAHGRIATPPINYGEGASGSLKTQPPPEKKKINNSNPAYSQGFFFYIHLLYGRNIQSGFFVF